ncbi:hypothetical protein CYLTODRAFT_492155 [Cylindrobasidium torrendii FP15055 ss-10]|uniref:Uncharacterized protein n=1 Tax=Cylindrobasidium torrendii FP15055 ss-10 TaxID=1314674 RepID=A0A0D7B7Y6_9AGAR|nr:hypothetical protein CYLTODRAFT_492155 [Cylindrobasidium torrendii FP15055 ss-10]
MLGGALNMCSTRRCSSHRCLRERRSCGDSLPTRWALITSATSSQFSGIGRKYSILTQCKLMSLAGYGRAGASSGGVLTCVSFDVILLQPTTMSNLNEEEMVTTAQARAKALNLEPYPDKPRVYERYRLTAGVVIPHDEVVDWDKRTSGRERAIWVCLGKLAHRYCELTGDWDANPFILVSRPYTDGQHDVMLVMATRRGEWTNRNARWAVEHVFDQELQFPPMPEKEQKVRDLLTKQLGFERLGDFITIYRNR